MGEDTEIRFLTAITQRGFKNPKVIIFWERILQGARVSSVFFTTDTVRLVPRREAGCALAGEIASAEVVGIRYLMQKTGKGRRPMEPEGEGRQTKKKDQKQRHDCGGYGTLSSGDLKIQLVPR